MEENLQEKLPITMGYPGVSARVKAIVIDSILLIIMMLLVTSLFSQFENVSDQARIIALIFIFLLYDPLLTSFSGATLGHRIVGLRVRLAANQTKNINFFLTIIRFVMKAALGWISLLTVQGNQMRKAMHDYLVGSVVVYAKIDRKK